MPGHFIGVWRPDGAVVAQNDQTTEGVVIADATDGSIVDRVTVPGGVTGFAWSPDGTLFATGGYDGFARVFDAESGAGAPDARRASRAWSVSSRSTATGRGW